MSAKQTYGMVPAGQDLGRLSGTLIVVEGPDSSGRSTQIALLTEWLESQGFAVQTMGLRRSALIGRDIDALLARNVVTRYTLALMYATDFYDQLESRIIPALRSGMVVLADRYLYTLIARAVVRGIEDIAYKHGYSIVLCNSDEDADKEQLYINVMRAEAVAGVILASASEANPQVDDLITYNIPVVAIDRQINDRQIDSVLAANIEGARAAVQAGERLAD